MQRIEQKKGRTPTPHAFQKLLKWLDQGFNSDGQTYLEMRRRLVSYFDRKNCSEPDDLADETLNRVARRLEEEVLIESETPAKYCYIVARFVFMESLRTVRKDNVLLDHVRRSHHNHLSNASDPNAKDNQERILNCLEQCIDNLDSSQREMILNYYTGEERTKIENRRALAASLGISMNALSIRACRIRDRLESCVRKCAGME